MCLNLPSSICLNLLILLFTLNHFKIEDVVEFALNDFIVAPDSIFKEVACNV